VSERATRISRERVQREWGEQGYRCDLWVDPPGSIWADFVHDVDERILVLDGSLILEMNGRVLSLGPGDEMTIPAGVRHTLRNAGEGVARWMRGHLQRTG
jgi:mannose-6-phosphate isomerase-like protein (cupin superfamily)